MTNMERGVVDAQVSPTGRMEVLSRTEAAALSNQGRGGLHAGARRYKTGTPFLQGQTPFQHRPARSAGSVDSDEAWDKTSIRHRRGVCPSGSARIFRVPRQSQSRARSPR
ncbi:MAG: hypothetical protein B7X91_15575 [Hydrogenophilales bacterium 17-64-11]|nr:MAG: hypothetical protein B7X91_15575 [Hydrogenophilales bacterium 17-64-11]